MLLTDHQKLCNYTAEHRLWQGIPAIEVTSKGRIFLAFYSGRTGEAIGNYAVLLKSDDGIHFEGPIAVADAGEEYRCYDPSLWIDPLGRLWFGWAVAPDHAQYASICEDPDAPTLVWGKPFKIGKDVMMNKPTVLSNGAWLFPVAVWKPIVPCAWEDSEDTQRKAFAYRSVDFGKTFERYGGAEVENRSCDEHMFLERKDGSIAMYVRTKTGIGVAYSYDGGKTWTDGEDTGWGGPDSRFFIRRLRSGRVLLINHHEHTGRSHLTAMLSEDEGKTWKYHLLLDERSNISYPDAVEAEDGYIYITYDRERGCSQGSMEKVYNCAREILVSRIAEADILAGQLVDTGSALKMVASKLGQYADENPFASGNNHFHIEIAKYMKNTASEKILPKLLVYYKDTLEKVDKEELQRLIGRLDDTNRDREETILAIIQMLSTASNNS